jgi:hypothetical protein
MNADALSLKNLLPIAFSRPSHMVLACSVAFV